MKMKGRRLYNPQSKEKEEFKRQVNANFYREMKDIIIRTKSSKNSFGNTLKDFK